MSYSLTFVRWIEARLEKELATWVVILAVGCYPIIGAITVFLEIPNRPVAVTYRIVYLGLALVILLFEWPTLKRRAIPIGLFCLSGFWLVYTGRIVNDFFIDGLDRGYASNGGLYFLQYGLGGCFLPAVAVGLAVERVNLTTLANALRIALFLSCLCVLGLIIDTQGFDLSILYSRARLGEDSVVGPIIVSQTGGGLLVLSGYELLLNRKGSVLIYIQFIVGLLLLVMGASRGPLIIGIALILVMLWQRFRWFWATVSYWGRVALTMIATLSLVQILILPNIKSISLFNRISVTVNKGQGLNERERQWSAAWNQFLENPILGDSVIENALNFYPHNLILEVLMSTGIVGGLFFFAMLALSTVKFSCRRSYGEGEVLIYLMVAYFGFALFSSSIITMVQFWILLGLVLALKPRKEIIRSI